MKQNKSLKTVCAILFSFLASSCVRIQDTEWCGYMGELGATCFHTLSDETRDMTLEEFKTWCAENGCVFGTSKTFAYYKGLLQKLCKSTRRCTYDDFKALEKFEGPQSK